MNRIRLLAWLISGLLALGVAVGTVSAIAPPVAPNTPTEYSIENVSTGLSHTCVVAPDESLWCVGDNRGGQLGDGSTLSKSTRVRIGASLNWSDVTAGSSHTCATTTAGALYCWGSNATGQLGTGNTTRKLTPTRVGSLNNWTSISAGSNHTCAINGGKIYCWGQNASGQLGINSFTNKNSPNQVGNATNWIQVTTDSASTHTCARNNLGGASEGGLYCWGLNANSQLGDNTITNQKSPVRIGTSTNWADVATGAAHSCAIRSGQGYCWGANAAGQLGIGSFLAKKVPTLISGSSSYVDIDAGSAGEPRGTHRQR